MNSIKPVTAAPLTTMSFAHYLGLPKTSVKRPASAMQGNADRPGEPAPVQETAASWRRDRPSVRDEVSSSGTHARRKAAALRSGYAHLLRAARARAGVIDDGIVSINAPGYERKCEPGRLTPDARAIVAANERRLGQAPGCYPLTKTARQILAANERRLGLRD